jgi:hypothetical protein
LRKRSLERRGSQSRIAAQFVRAWPPAIKRMNGSYQFHKHVFTAPEHVHHAGK